MGFGVELGAASTECGRTVIDRTRQKCVAVLWRTCMQGHMLVYHSTLGLRVREKKKVWVQPGAATTVCGRAVIVAESASANPA